MISFDTQQLYFGCEDLQLYHMDFISKVLSTNTDNLISHLHILRKRLISVTKTETALFVITKTKFQVKFKLAKPEENFEQEFFPKQQQKRKSQLSKNN